MHRDNIIWRILRRREILRREKEEKPFDTSSIGDMAFLLLIFFIVTSSFILRQGIFFSMPSKVSGSIRLDKKEIFEIYPRNDGFLYNGKIIDREEFKDKLTFHKKNTRQGVLMIKMKKDVKYERLVDTLSVAKETAVTKVSLKNIEEEW